MEACVGHSSQEASVHQVQRCLMSEGKDEAVLELTTYVKNVPFADCFYVLQRSVAPCTQPPARPQVCACIRQCTARTDALK